MFPDTNLLSVAFGYNEAIEENSFLIDDTLVFEVFKVYNQKEEKLLALKKEFLNFGYNEEQAQAMLPQVILRMLASKDSEKIEFKIKDIKGEEKIITFSP